MMAALAGCVGTLKRQLKDLSSNQAPHAQDVTRSYIIVTALFPPTGYQACADEE